MNDTQTVAGPDSQTITAYVKCKYKAFLRSVGRTGVKSDYELLQEELDSTYAESFRKKCNEDRLKFRTISVVGNGVTHPVSGLFREKKGKSLFTPIVFSRTGKITKDLKLQLAMESLLAGKGSSSAEVEQGIIVHGPSFVQTKMTISAMKKLAANHLDKMSTAATGTPAPKLIINRHCKVCEFQHSCREEAIKTDDLSLLSLKEKEITSLNKRGLFTITQLSHTFRPKRRLRNLEIKKRPRQHALHALAIREKKVHVFAPKALSLANTKIFLDVESDAEKEFYYLIGLVIKTPESERRMSFWADNKHLHSAV